MSLSCWWQVVVSPPCAGQPAVGQVRQRKITGSPRDQPVRAVRAGVARLGDFAGLPPGSREGAHIRDRTGDLSLTKTVLYLLSYVGRCAAGYSPSAGSSVLAKTIPGADEGT